MLGTLIVVLVVFFLLSGAINQVKTGETLAEYATDIGKSLGDMFSKLPNGAGPFKWDDGIYFKNANVPNESAIDKDKLPDVPSGDDINNAANKAQEKGSEILNK